ncbi:MULTISPECIES: DUF1803 domain-containing protein [unclassified Enterococcus]|uniref:DUF1803 domain-containing protein n=1 Tax=unclassified Enterococcus TaxID=2608891 RepID=UPI002474E63B|nr:MULTISPECIES: DUF1803 domain-containing protein [unclassified Enterococcus]
MNFYYNQQNKQYQKIINQPLFSEIVAYFQEHQETEIILRSLKKQFPQKNFEALLEKMIQAGLILRENRRYTLAFSIIAEKKLDYPKLDFGFPVVDAEKLAFFNRLYELWFEDTDYFFATSEIVPFYEKRLSKNQKLQFTHIVKKVENQQQLADYFYILQNGLEMPSNLQSVETLIGDVNPDYFLNQVALIMENIKNGKKNRESIFLTALKETLVINQLANEIILPEVKTHLLALPEALTDLTFSQDTTTDLYQKWYYFDYLLAEAGLSSIAFYEIAEK